MGSNGGGSTTYTASHVSYFSWRLPSRIISFLPQAATWVSALARRFPTLTAALTGSSSATATAATPASALRTRTVTPPTPVTLPTSIRVQPVRPAGTATSPRTSAVTWTYVRTESTVDVTLRSEGGTVLVAGTPTFVVADVSYFAWEVWRSSAGENATRNARRGPATGAKIAFQTQKSDGTLTGVATSSVTDNAGKARIPFTMGSVDCKVVASVSYLGSRSSGTLAFQLSHPWERISMAYGPQLKLRQIADSGEGLAVIEAHLDLFTTVLYRRQIGGRTEEITVTIASGPAIGAPLQLTVNNPATTLRPISTRWLAGSGPVWNGETDSAGSFQAAVRLTSATELQVLASYGGATITGSLNVQPAGQQAAAAVPSDSGWAYSATKGILNVHFSASAESDSDGNWFLRYGETTEVIAELTLKSWEIWTHTSGAIETRNYRTAPAAGANIQGTCGNSNADANGEFRTPFTMGSGKGGISFSASCGNYPSTFAKIDFYPLTTASGNPVDWTYLGTPRTSVNGKLQQVGSTVTATLEASQTEVFVSVGDQPYGMERLGRTTTGPAIGSHVEFFLGEPSGPLEFFTEGETNTAGAFSAQVVVSRPMLLKMTGTYSASTPVDEYFMVYPPGSATGGSGTGTGSTGTGGTGTGGTGSGGTGTGTGGTGTGTGTGGTGSNDDDNLTLPSELVRVVCAFHSVCAFDDLSGGGWGTSSSKPHKFNPGTPIEGSAPDDNGDPWSDPNYRDAKALRELQLQQIKTEVGAAAPLLVFSVTATEVSQLANGMRFEWAITYPSRGSLGEIIMQTTPGEYEDVQDNDSASASKEIANAEAALCLSDPNIVNIRHEGPDQVREGADWTSKILYDYDMGTDDDNETTGGGGVVSGHHYVSTDWKGEGGDIMDWMEIEERIESGFGASRADIADYLDLSSLYGESARIPTNDPSKRFARFNPSQTGRADVARLCSMYVVSATDPRSMYADFAEGRTVLVWLERVHTGNPKIDAMTLSRTFLRQKIDIDDDWNEHAAQLETFTLTIAPNAMVSNSGGNPNGSGTILLRYEGRRGRVTLLPIEVVDIKDHEIAGDDVTISPWEPAQPIADSNIAWIEAHSSKTDPAPRMPQLELRAAGLPQGMTLEAKLEVQYVRGNNAKPTLNRPDDRVKIPADGSFQVFNGDTWQIWQGYANESFFGGEASLTYRLMNGQNQVLTPQALHFRIGGRNPNDLRCRAFIESQPDAGPNGNLWFAYAIAKHESASYNDTAQNQNTRYNQFLELPRHQNDVARPVWHDDNVNDAQEPGGYGIFQVTLDPRQSGVPNPIPRAAIWSWQENVREALSILSTKRTAANAWMQTQSNQASVALPNHQVGNVTFQVGTPRTMVDAVTMKEYNGSSRPNFDTIDNGVVAGFILDPHSSGRYCYWRTEYRRQDNPQDPDWSQGTKIPVPIAAWALSRLNDRGFNYVQRVCSEVTP